MKLRIQYQHCQTKFARTDDDDDDMTVIYFNEGTLYFNG